MSTGSNAPKQKKGSRVSGVQLQPNRITVAMDMLKRADVLSRLGMTIIAGLLMWLVTMGWQRPFPFALGDVPERAIVARVEFETDDDARTKTLKEVARREVITIYKHDRTQVEQLILQLEDKVKQIHQAESLKSLIADPVTKNIWKDFMFALSSSGSEEANTSSVETSPEYFAYFEEFKDEFKEDADITKFMQSVSAAMTPIVQKGLFPGLQHDFDKEGGSMSQIRIAIDDETTPELTQVDDVRIAVVMNNLKEQLESTFSEPLARHAFAWFSAKEQLSQTLTYDPVRTKEAAQQKADDQPMVKITYGKGATLAPGGEPIDVKSLALLREEYDMAASKDKFPQKISRTVAGFGMYATIFSLCGFYSLFRRSQALTDTTSLLRVLSLSVVTIGLCKLASFNSPETILIPLLLYSMTIVIAYEQELALLLSTAMALVVVVSLGLRLQEFTVFVAAMATAVLCLRHVRNRTKLIYVGLVIAAIAAATAIGSATLADPSQGYGILVRAAWCGFFSVVAGMLMSASLPFIETLFDVQTELSLLELADVSHPLLQELVRRAPGTYNHTINVASIAEAAADSINANGLLVRVGAYFHDIGKMLKPGYFIENQGDGGNRHESLLPAMSTLVIIAHVKDGADLARQHNLPNVLVDFIMQHHGTTLVEYFYNRASEQSESDPDGAEVDEHSFRYPGPKPQTKETAVLMLADTVESACRSLTEPTPSRIEGLVHDLAMKKLLDGQFDECGLTLAELKKVEVSLTKSVSAVYHSRIKYPDQQSA